MDAPSREISTDQHDQNVPPERSRYHRFDTIIASGTIDDIKALRSEIHGLKASLERKLSNDRSDRKIRTAELVGQGMDFNEAQLVVDNERNEWRGRSANLLRRCHEWSRQIREKLHAHVEAQPIVVPYAAVVIPGAGRTAAKVAEACNLFLQRNCVINAFSVVGIDLVVVLKEPKSE